MANIKTGADRLIDLISEKKKINIDSAAKLLGVGKNVVQEWAEFLEEEGLITIDYSFSQIWLYEKKITKDDVLDNAKRLDSQKEALTRKIDVILGSINQESSGFDEVKKHFNEMQSHIKNELDTVKKQLEELEKYDQLKKNLDKDIEQQKLNYAEIIKKTSQELREEEQKYLTITNQIESERKNIDGYMQKIEAFKKTKADVDKNIVSLREYIKSIEKTISENKSLIENSDKKIAEMKSSLQKLENEIKNKKSKNIETTLTKIQKQMSEFSKKQDEMSEKIKSKTSQMSNYIDIDKKIQDNFKGFFINNIEINKLMDAISSEKNDLAKDLESMKARGTTFSAISKNKEISVQMKEIEEELKKVEKRKSGILSKIEKLFSLIRGKNK